MKLTRYLCVAVLLAVPAISKDKNKDKDAPKRSEVSGPERIEMLDMMSKYDDLVTKSKEVQDKINATALGKEQAEITKQMDALGKEYTDKINKILEEHGAKGCGLSRSLTIINCPVDKPTE